jgi:hypothetical protein
MEMQLEVPVLCLESRGPGRGNGIQLGPKSPVSRILDHKYGGEGDTVKVPLESTAEYVSEQPSGRIRIIIFALCLAAIFASEARAETCTTQSQLSDTERDGLASAAKRLAGEIQAADFTTLRGESIAEVTKDFSSLRDLVSGTAPRLAGGKLVVDQVYLLDALTLKKNPDGSNADSQFFCSLNRSTMEADFLIPALPPGKYGFAIVNSIAPQSGVPWRLAFLMRQESSKWLLAGFYPKPLTAGGHDGLWYWTQARDFTKQKQPWNAWLYYQAAYTLLRPADFVLSTHLDKLRTEATAAAPPALSEGISSDAPLVVKAKDGAEFHFTGLGVDDSLSNGSIDVAVHLHVEPGTDAGAQRKTNDAAVAALVAAYPELRKPFHGVEIIAEAAGQAPFTTELPMSDIR